MIKQLLAILLIFLGCSFAWAILGATVLWRTNNLDSSNQTAVGQLWGLPQVQNAPSVWWETQKQVMQVVYDSQSKTHKQIGYETEKHSITLDDSKVRAALKLDYRQKGLLWYSTYKVHFAGEYKFANPTNQPQRIHVQFPLPATQAIYDNFQILIGTQSLRDVTPNQNAIEETFTVNPGTEQSVSLSYDSQGLGSWKYDFGSAVSQVKNFSLSLTTDFDEIDFPSGSISPTNKKKLPQGWELNWHYTNLLTGYDVGVTLPEKLNPGPWVSKVTFFAPVSLFLFMFVLLVLSTIKGLRIHPMNYFFIAAAFFSFHLLLAYLVDHISVDLAFAISSVVSIILVISYMRLVVSNRFAFVDVAVCQLLYLVGFSYTFFYEQYTGLVITILCVLTLFIMMQITGRTDWSEVFRNAGRSKESSAIAPSQT